MISNLQYLEKKLDFFTRNAFLLLSIIGVISYLIRLYYFPYHVPIVLDGFNYFLYATDTSILGHLPTGYDLPNNGWPIFVSLFFKFFHSNNFLDYMTLQRVISITVSTLTIIPVYLFARRFFDKRFSIIGASLFAFEPHIIQNSLLGVTEPLFIFLISISLYLFLSERIKEIYLSFGVAALCAMVRYEGLLLFVLLSIAFFIRFRNERKNLVRYVIAFGIFVLILLPMAYLRTQTMGYDGFTSHLTAGAEASVILSTPNNSNQDSSLFHFVGGGLENMIIYLGLTSLPFWVFFVPVGVYLILKEKRYKNILLVLSLIILSITALYAYSREIPDTRYLYVLFPFYSIISLFTIRKLVEKTKNQNLFLILILGGVCLTCAIYLDIKNYDYAHQLEAYNIDQFIAKTAKSVNRFYPEDNFLKPADLPSNWPVLKSTLSIQTKISTDGFYSLEDYIKASRSYGLTHLIVDDKQDRPNFLNYLFYHEEKYPYLMKIYDSKDYNYKYHVKIFEINYTKYDSIKQL